MAADSPLQRDGGRTDRPSPTRPHPLRPLRRRPKQLTDYPILFEASGGGSGAGLALPSDRLRDPRRPQAKQGASVAGLTDEVATLLSDVPLEARVDAEAIRRARQIAERLAIPHRRPARARRSGFGELASVPYRGGSDDIDLDATLENLVATPIPDEDDIVVRERLRTRRSVVLAVDVSGSMNGERALTAAATVGALYGELRRDDLAVIAFWSDAALLARLGEATSAARLLESLVRIPAQGLTNVAFPLQVAAKQLTDIAPLDAQVLLLSDCVHNAGPDPRIAAATLPRLDVLVDTSGEHDLELARELARAGHGRAVLAHSYRDVGPAVSTLFGG